MTFPESNDTVLIVCADLFFAPQLQREVQLAGLRSQTVLSMAKAVEVLQEQAFRWVVIDLELPGLNLPELQTAAVVGSSPPPLIGFAPHVHEELMRRAGEAGCQVLLTRGQASRLLSTVLKKGLPQ